MHVLLHPHMHTNCMSRADSRPLHCIMAEHALCLIGTIFIYFHGFQASLAWKLVNNIGQLPNWLIFGKPSHTVLQQSVPRRTACHGDVAFVMLHESLRNCGHLFLTLATMYFRAVRRGSTGFEQTSHFGARLCAVSLAFLICLSAADGKDIRVGGDAGWTLRSQYADIEASVGDRLVSDRVVSCCC